METKPIVKGRCHCACVEFEVKLPNRLEDLSRCNCSICSRRGAVVTSVPYTHIIKDGQTPMNMLLMWHA